MGSDDKNNQNLCCERLHEPASSKLWDADVKKFIQDPKREQVKYGTGNSKYHHEFINHFHVPTLWQFDIIGINIIGRDADL